MEPAIKVKRGSQVSLRDKKLVFLSHQGLGRWDMAKNKNMINKTESQIKTPPPRGTVISLSLCRE